MPFADIREYSSLLLRELQNILIVG